MPEGRQGAVLTLVLAVSVHCLMLSYVLSYAVLNAVRRDICGILCCAVLSCAVLYAHWWSVLPVLPPPLRRVFRAQDSFVPQLCRTLLYDRTLLHDRLVRAARELQTMSPKFRNGWLWSLERSGSGWERHPGSSAVDYFVQKASSQH